MPPTVDYNADTGIYKNTIKLPEIPAISTFAFLTQHCNFSTETLAFVEHSRKRLKNGDREVCAKSITHGQLKLQAHRLGHGLLTKGGLQPGDIVMILGTNCIEWVTVMLAAQFAGLVVALASPAYGTHELKHVVNLAKPKCIFLPSKLLIKATRAQISWASLVTYDVASGMPEIGFTQNLMATEEEGRHAQPYRIENFSETPAFLPFSSGTTGLPKGVEITHRNVVAMLTILKSATEIYASPTRILNCLPFFHAMALLLHVCMPIKLQCTVHIQVPFDPELFIALIEKEEIEQVSAVPPLLLLFGQLERANRQSFKSVRYLGCGAAPLAAETQNRIAERLGCPVVQGWGMTETTVGCLGMHFGTTSGTCGRVMPGIEAKLVDPETGKTVAPGERGEMWVRGPNIMKGYYKNLSATQQTKTDDGWLKTGDVAVATKEGDFCVVDRIKELIKYKGNQIAPAELEALILTHPKVASVGVVGIYDESQATELPRAYLQLAPRCNATGIEDEVQAFVRQRAGHAKWLRGGVRVVEQLPVTPSGKILRKDLRLLVKAEMEREAKSKL